MSTKIFEGFSISHAAILNGTTGAEEAVGDIYGVREGSLAPNMDSYDNTGDDAVLSSWYWLNFATVQITSGFISFELIALLSGTTITSSGAAPSDQYSLPMWNEKSMNQPSRPLLIRVPSKDSNGVTRVMDIVLFKVQFEPFSFDGPSYKNGLLLNYTGKALTSSVDEAGNALSDRAVGRLLNKPS